MMKDFTCMSPSLDKVSLTSCLVVQLEQLQKLGELEKSLSDFVWLGSDEDSSDDDVPLAAFRGWSRVGAPTEDLIGENNMDRKRDEETHEKFEESVDIFARNYMMKP
ncbi:hypothetical protein JTB14_020469 [Gonioctena quinquepunctata]|nr:hypothetical protein JTB14_020469 [Gonioctena quinquepunctata]